MSKHRHGARNRKITPQYTVYYRPQGDIMRRSIKSHRSLAVAMKGARLTSKEKWIDEAAVIDDRADSDYTVVVARFKNGEQIGT